MDLDDILTSPVRPEVGMHQRRGVWRMVEGILAPGDNGLLSVCIGNVSPGNRNTDKHRAVDSYRDPA